MKTIRLSDEEYDRLLYILEYASDVLRYEAADASVKVALDAEELASTIVCNTNQHDSDDQDDEGDAEQWMSEGRKLLRGMYETL